MEWICQLTNTKMSILARHSMIHETLLHVTAALVLGLETADNQDPRVNGRGRSQVRSADHLRLQHENTAFRRCTRAAH